MLFFLLISASLAAQPLLNLQQSSWSFHRVNSSVDGHLNVVPLPKTVVWSTPYTLSCVTLQNESFAQLEEQFASIGGPRWQRAVVRFRQRVTSFVADSPNALPFADQKTWLACDDASSVLRFTVACDVYRDLPSLGDDESYTLNINRDDSGVTCAISAQSSGGVLRAFVTVLQLIARRNGSAYLPVGLRVQDEPVYGWRGLMVDVARHYHPMQNIYRIVDGMEFLKLNVLHVHLTDDQGWRFEMLGNWSRLQTVGGEGVFYTQAELRELVEYCKDRGIRVIPEFDMPGHFAAGLLSYEELNTFYRPSEPVHTWGAFNYSLDPSSEVVFSFVAELINQSSSVFADDMIHLGGDEVIWGNMDVYLSAWKAQNNVSSLGAYFFKRAATIAATQFGKTVIGWDEVVHYDLPEKVVIQWWRMAGSFSHHRGVQSSGFYLDLFHTIDQLAKEEIVDKMVGAEACAWSEYMRDNMDTRLFPSLIGAAENFWKGTTASANLMEENRYPRVCVVDASLALVGVSRDAVFRAQVAALAGGNTTWSYADATAPPATTKRDHVVEGPLFDSLLLLCSSVTSLWRNIATVYSSFDLGDIALPESLHVVSMQALAKQALVEQLNPSGFATSLLVQTIQLYAALNDTITSNHRRHDHLDPAVYVVAGDISKMAKAWLDWIYAVQGSSPADLRNKRLLAKAMGYGKYTLSSGFKVENALKSVGAILTKNDIGPFGYIEGTETTATTTAATTGSTASTTTATTGSTASTTTATTRSTASTTAATTTASEATTASTSTGSTTTPTTTTAPSSTSTLASSSSASSSSAPPSTSQSVSGTSVPPSTVLSTSASDTNTVQEESGWFSTRIVITVVGTLLVVSAVIVAIILIVRRCKARRRNGYEDEGNVLTATDDSVSNEDLFDDL